MNIILVGSGITSRENTPLTSLATYREFIRARVTGRSVIVGRRTYEQPGFGELLENLSPSVTVLSSRIKKNPLHPAEVAEQLDEALVHALQSSSDICVIGGESIFNEVIKRASRVWYLTVDHAQCPTSIKNHGFILAKHSPTIEAWPQQPPSAPGQFQPEQKGRTTAKLSAQCWLRNLRTTV